ncbi:MAG: cation:proton antiporter [Thiotrichales bacterium]|mgnify:FL=1|jgi:multicomponent Na+:H+ antiporter subunit F|nr:cation:proton antiporter [Thiotrichales bacterium]MBT3613193.1 cation:proton antiporter [Thiotrichales bacterium]MBT3752773.1 cation:proton antiporter [Thiotrichales bacterium]MBT3838135.1 cation:proton antiporter [Thiotrichales bacterium]MBT4151510.1 cation:proton antiporter [Thiotrichales bacterium]
MQIVQIDAISTMQFISLLLVGGAVLLTLLRFLIGPTGADRVVATDVAGVIATVSVALAALFFGSALYLDLALLFGVLSFVGVIALARTMLGGRR